MKTQFYMVKDIALRNPFVTSLRIAFYARRSVNKPIRETVVILVATFVTFQRHN